jgi:glycosyltransferase involved in cell wall biosynthesis
MEPEKMGSAQSPGGPARGVSVILPVYNERENLEELHSRLTKTLEQLDREYEVVYVDDGSDDDSWEALRRLAFDDARVRLIRFRKNFGQTPALAAGMHYARFPILVTMDADLQNDPADIPRLLRTLESGYDVVSGWRRHRQDRTISRRLPSRIANWLIGLVTGVRLHDSGCALKVYRREILNDVRLYGEMHRFLPVLVAWVGGRVVEVEVAHHPRIHGVSKYGIVRTFKVLLDLMTVKFLRDYSSKPNYVFGGFGLAMLCLGFVSFLVVAYRVFVLRHLEATPLVFMMVIFFLIGVFSVFVGLLAEIIIRGQYEAHSRPTYYVQETVGLESER